MTHFKNMLVSGANLNEFSKALTMVIQSLPPGDSKRLQEIRLAYLRRYGIEGVCKRMNDRMVSQIFDEYQPADVKPLVAGELDGVRYELYDAPGAGERDSDGEEE